MRKIYTIDAFSHKDDYLVKYLIERMNKSLDKGQTLYVAKKLNNANIIPNKLKKLFELSEDKSINHLISLTLYHHELNNIDNSNIPAECKSRLKNYTHRIFKNNNLL